MRGAQDKRNRPIAVILTALFVVFTFLFYVFFQRDLIALMQETWSRGQTINNPLVTAMIAALVLFLSQRLVKGFTRFAGRWEAFTWLPSYLLLGFSTSVDSHTMHYDLVPWAAVLGGCLLVLLVVGWLRRFWPPDKRASFLSLLLPGIVVTIISMVICMVLTNHDAALHQELAAWRYAARGDAGRVAAVGRRSLETTPSLTALRNVALAHEGRIGDELFTYPQPYGVDGLDVSRYTRQNTQFGAKVFYDFLGHEPYGGENASAFFARLYRQDDSPLHRDLYAASLLLEGRLADFVQAFPPPSSSLTSVLSPRHWREAWLLCRDLTSYEDEELQPLLDDFLTTLRTSHTNRQATLNALYLTYGQTYWYYYYSRQ